MSKKVNQSKTKYNRLINAPDQNERQMLSKLSVLYVEDETMLRLRMTPVLEELFAETYVASDGITGLAAYRSLQPDIILTDVNMPHMDGLEMAEQIRQLDPYVPIIVLSAFSSSENLMKAVNIGVDGFVQKSFSENDIMKALVKHGKIQLQKKELDEAYNLLEEYQAVVDAGSPVLKTDPAGMIIFVNDAFCRMYGARRDQLLHTDVRELFAGGKGTNFALMILSSIRKKKLWKGAINLRTYRGEELYLNTVIVPIRNQQGKIDEFIALCHNVTELIRTKMSLEVEKERFKLLSITDTLTGVYNRQEFNNSMVQEAERVNRYGETLSLILFDIDHFKLVNDEWGHQVGDRLLIIITQLVKHRIRRVDVFARIGGEEFAILMPQTDLEQAGLVAEKLRFIIETSTSDREYTSNIFSTDYSSVLGTGPRKAITCSFGVAQMSQNESIEGFFKRTDDALYESKRRGRNRVISSCAEGGYILQSDLIRIFGEQRQK